MYLLCAARWLCCLYLRMIIPPGTGGECHRSTMIPGKKHGKTCVVVISYETKVRNPVGLFSCCPSRQHLSGICLHAIPTHPMKLNNQKLPTSYYHFQSWRPSAAGKKRLPKLSGKRVPMMATQGALQASMLAFLIVGSSICPNTGPPRELHRYHTEYLSQ